MRSNNLKVELDLSSSAFGKQLKRADRSGAPIALILGDEEAQNQTVKLKWLKSAQETTIPSDQLIADPTSYLELR